MEVPVIVEDEREMEEEEEDGTGRFPIIDGGNGEDDVDGLIVTVRTHTNPQGTSTIGAVFLIINAALGAGLLNFPQQFHEAGGVLSAVLVQAALLVFIMLALLILASASNIKQSNTLQDVMHTVSGEWGRRLTSFVIAVYCFGTCITFLVIIGDQFDRAFYSLVGPDFCKNFFLNRNFLMPVSSVVLILPLCYTKKIDFLKYVSAAGVLTILYIVILIFVQYFRGDHVPGEIRHHPESVLEVFNVIPVICFGYQCHVSVIPIYSCMRHRNIKHFSIAVSAAIAFCVFTYTGAATFGYLTFGSNVASDILQNYSAHDPFVMVALIAMALKTYTTYPILLFCGREGTSSLVRELFIKEDSPRKEMVRRCSIATIWFILSVVMAVKIPNIGAIIDILGSLAAIFIFIFPGVCLLQSTLMTDPGLIKPVAKLKICLAISFLLLGTFLFGVVLTQGLESDARGTGGSSHLLCTP